MKKSLLALSVAALAGALPAVSHADLAYNVGVVTDYRYRGISQSRLKPAVQGGVDYTQGGLYLGAWASTIKWIKDAGGDANIELDLYGGYKGEITKELTYDVGILNYHYQGAVTSAYSGLGLVNPNTSEIYGALTYGPATLKYSHALTNTFGNPDSKNSSYLDLSATFEVIDGWSLAPHVGYQKIKGPFDDAATYSDFSLTLSKDFKGLVPSVAIVATDSDKTFYVTPAGKHTGKSALVLGLKYNF